MNNQSIMKKNFGRNLVKAALKWIIVIVVLVVIALISEYLTFKFFN